MRILICGGAGFIGSNMSAEAISRGHSVIAFDNLWRPNVSSNIKHFEKTYPDNYSFVWGDVRNPEDLEKVGEIDAVIHLAANPGAIDSVHYPIYDFRSNAIGTFNVLSFAKKRNVPVIYASTTKTMSDIVNTFPMEETETRYIPTGVSPEVKDGVELGEDGKPEAINDKFPIDGFGKYGHSPYGISKLTGELYAQEFHVTFGLPVVIFRMSCIYGLYQQGIEEQGWVSWFLKQLLTGDKKLNIFGNGKQVRDVLDGRDVAKAYLNALENISDPKINGQIFTIGGSTKFNYSLLEVIAKIEELTGNKAELTFLPKRPADQDWFIMSYKKCKELLDWEPTIDLDQALRDMLAQLKP